MNANKLTDDINMLWTSGEQTKAITTLHARLHQVATDQINPGLWSLYREVQHHFVVAWLNDPSVKFESFLGK